MNILKYPNISNSLKESVQTIKLNLSTHSSFVSLIVTTASIVLVAISPWGTKKYNLLVNNQCRDSINFP